MCAEKMHADEVDIDADLVRRLLAAQLPRWADLRIEPVASAGTVNAIYRLGDDMAVRLPRVGRWARSLETEYEWLPKLAPHLPLAVPEPLAKGSPGEGYPWNWAVYRWLEGDTWAVDRIRDLREAAADLARFIIAWRRVDTADGPRHGGEVLADRDRYVRRAIAASHGLIDTDAVSAAWGAALQAPAWDGAPVWLHGDLWRPTNLLVAGGRLTAVIDFGGLSVGDPARELMAAWSLFSGESRETFRAALSVDDATWARGRGWALTCVMAIPYYVETNPVIFAEARHAIEEVLADHRSGT
ncbi:MAG: aminoglycoside phosphotransferase family protein [Dehalococcoidia bacterium]